MIPATTPLIGFSGEIIWPIGQILLPVKIRDAEHFTSTWMNFVVVRSPSPYNGIIGRPEVRKIQAVTPEARPFDIIHAAEERIKVVIHPEHPEQTITIGSTLTEEGRKALCDLLRRSLDVFAWKPADMTGNVGATYQHLVDKALQKQLAVQKHLAETWKSIIEERTFPWGYNVTTEGNNGMSDKIAEAKAAFKEMKKLIAEFLTLTAPMEKEELIVYLTVTQEAYRLRTSVKGQILADFIVERPEDDSLDTPMEAEEELLDPWTLFTNESSCIDGSGARLILTNLEGSEFTYALRFRPPSITPHGEENVLAEKENAKRAVRQRARSMHARTRYVVAKAIRTGYYWLKMHADARKLIRACQDCQFHRLGPGKVKFLIVAMDYFTKWIEAKPVATITDNPFKDWCEKLCICHCFASVKHPQANGLVERANRSLGEGIKARLDERSKDWIKEFPHVLWAHRTMIKLSNGDTPFSLTYGTEAVIPAEIGMPTIRTAEVDMVQNDEALEINLDLLDERREQVAIREAKSKAKMEKYYNSKVHNTSFKPGDHVYRSNEVGHSKESGKLSPK
ncbi:reverse transcriptase domain-containing protein [Tanacetum coccineum]